MKKPTLVKPHEAHHEGDAAESHHAPEIHEHEHHEPAEAPEAEAPAQHVEVHAEVHHEPAPVEVAPEGHTDRDFALPLLDRVRRDAGVPEQREEHRERRKARQHRGQKRRPRQLPVLACQRPGGVDDHVGIELGDRSTHGRQPRGHC